MLKNFEITFGIIKPHVIRNPIAHNGIHELINKHNFKIVHSKIVQVDKHLAERFYEEHTNKFFYNRLITFMTSGPSEALILKRSNAIAKWREIMGPTKVYKAIYSHPETIRGRFGLSDTRNAAHGSDSPESVKREIGIFFPEFNISEHENKL